QPPSPARSAGEQRASRHHGRDRERVHAVRGADRNVPRVSPVGARVAAARSAAPAARPHGAEQPRAAGERADPRAGARARPAARRRARARPPPAVPAPALGVLFLAVQGVGWPRLVRHGLPLGGSLSGATFYVLIGCHAAPVVIALPWLPVVAILASRRFFTAD